MEILEFLSRLSPALTSIFIMGWFGLVIYQKFFSAKSQLEKETYESYERRHSQQNQEIEDLKRLIKENDEKSQARFTESVRNIAKLEGVVQEKDRHIESLTQLIQGKNPEILEILESVKESLVEVKMFTKASLEWMKEAQTTLDYQSGMLEENDKRNKTIDVAHKAVVHEI